MNDSTVKSPDFVSYKFTKTLEVARAHLEEYVGGPSGRETLARCAKLLHYFCGELKSAEIHGAALFAEEMKKVCQHLEVVESQSEVDKGIEALKRAMSQLAIYLAHLLDGCQDAVLVLLPLLNYLRKICGNPLLSEDALILLNNPHHPAEMPNGQVWHEGSDSHKFRDAAQALRPAFQVALLGWVRDENSTGDLLTLARISSALEEAATTDVVHRFWHILTGVLQGLADRKLEATVTLKGLLGQSDRQLKRLTNEGEAAFANSLPIELINNLLYYFERSGGKNGRLQAIRSEHVLTDAITAEEQLLKARLDFSGTSATLMQIVLQAVKQDLTRVKDALDVFTHIEMEDVNSLKPQLEILKKIGNTLGILNLGVLRDDIQRQSKAISLIIMGQSVPDQIMLEKITATLLDVESILSRGLINAAVPKKREGSESDNNSEGQYYQGAQSTTDECILSLAKIKKVVIQLVDDPSDVHILDQIRLQLCVITAGLLVLNKTQAGRVVERIGEVIASHLTPGETLLRPELLELLADSIASIEHYMETVSVGRDDQRYVLESAERYLDALELIPTPDVHVGPSEQQERIVGVPRGAPSKVTGFHPEVIKMGPDSTPAFMGANEAHSDPERIELFIEKAKEEFTNIKRNLSAWRENPDYSEALICIWKSFQSLRDSAQVVGVPLISEYARGVEGLLAQIVNQDLEPTEAIREFVGKAAAALPELVEQLEVGTPPHVDIQLLLRQADAFTEGDSGTASLASDALPGVQVRMSASVIEPSRGSETTDALIVNVGEETFALPLPTVEGITRVPKDRLLQMLTKDEPNIEHSGINYRLQHLGFFVGAGPSALSGGESLVSLVLVRAGENSTALITDSLEGSQKVVVEALGSHINSIPGVTGAARLGDGRIVIILEVRTLVRSQRDDGLRMRTMRVQPNELHSLLIPLQRERLLVPRVCVAEVIAFTELGYPREGEGLPEWYLGCVDWNTRRVPIVSFEVMSGKTTKKRAGQTRIVIFHALSDRLLSGYYGIIAQGLPQLVRVDPDILSADLENPWAEELPVLCRTRMNNEQPLIPDMDLLEEMLIELIA
ncbi:MAG: chemotaxis protein CheW [Pseudomonadota bacterium]|nr:chemotaxis protein CheW [Pseudomonadota bacterium]